MSEILIHYDYNGGFFCRSHYSPMSPFGIGRSAEEAVKDWMRKNFWWDKESEPRRYVNLRVYKLYLMDKESEKSFGAEDIPNEKVLELEEWVNSLPHSKFLPTKMCPHCGQVPFTPFTASHYE